MAETTATAPLLGARLDTIESGTVLVLPTTFDAPPDRVWDYLTQPPLMAHWAPVIPLRPLVRTGPVKLRQVEDDGKPGRTRRSEVTEVEDSKRLTYRWGRDWLTWELCTAGDGTALELHHLMSDPTDAPGLSAGWHLSFTVVAERLAGRPAQPILGLPAVEHGFLQLYDRYKELLEEPAAP